MVLFTSVNVVKSLSCTVALNFHKSSFFFHSQYDRSITEELFSNQQSLQFLLKHKLTLISFYPQLSCRCLRGLIFKEKFLTAQWKTKTNLILQVNGV